MYCMLCVKSFNDGHISLLGRHPLSRNLSLAHKLHAMHKPRRHSRAQAIVRPWSLELGAHSSRPFPNKLKIVIGALPSPNLVDKTGVRAVKDWLYAEQRRV